MNKKMENEELKLKYDEMKRQNIILQRKIENMRLNGGIDVNKSILSLKPGKIYLMVTEGRRIVGKIVFENKGFVCYTKRDGTKYYANKKYIILIKELTEKEQKSYGLSNFGDDEDEDKND
jgi:hypothetical protein